MDKIDWITTKCYLNDFCSFCWAQRLALALSESQLIIEYAYDENYQKLENRTEGSVSTEFFRSRNSFVCTSDLSASSQKSICSSILVCIFPLCIPSDRTAIGWTARERRGLMSTTKPTLLWEHPAPEGPQRVLLQLVTADLDNFSPIRPETTRRAPIARTHSSHRVPVSLLPAQAPRALPRESPRVQKFELVRLFYLFIMVIIDAKRREASKSGTMSFESVVTPNKGSDSIFWPPWLNWEAFWSCNGHLRPFLEIRFDECRLNHTNT